MILNEFLIWVVVFCLGYFIGKADHTDTIINLHRTQYSGNLSTLAGLLAAEMRRDSGYGDKD